MQWLWAIWHCPSLSPCMGIDEVFSLLPPSTPLIQDENSQMQCPSCQVIDSDICLAHYQALFNILQFDFLWVFFFIFCHFELSINVFIYAPWCLSSMEGNKEWWRLLKGFSVSWGRLALDTEYQNATFLVDFRLFPIYVSFTWHRCCTSAVYFLHQMWWKWSLPALECTVM